MRYGGISELVHDYRQLAKQSARINDPLLSSLKEKVRKLEIKYLRLKMPLQDSDIDGVNQIAEEIERGYQILRKVEEKKNLEDFHKRIESLKDYVLNSDGIIELHKKEIYDYFETIKEKQDPFYPFDKLEASFKAVENRFKLSYLRITQNILFHETGQKDWNSHDQLEKELPEIINNIPEIYREKFVNSLLKLATTAYADNDANLYITAKALEDHFVAS